MIDNDYSENVSITIGHICTSMIEYTSILEKRNRNWIIKLGSYDELKYRFIHK